MKPFADVRLQIVAVFSVCLLLLQPTSGRVRGGSFGGGGFGSRGGGSRVGSSFGSSGSSFSGGFSFRRPSTFSSTFSSSSVYSKGSVVRTTYGRSVVPYRSITPIGGTSYVVPVIYSPVRYRPIFVPLYFHHHYHTHYYYYSRRYYETSTNSQTSSGTPSIQSIFVNVANHCAKSPVYGIDGQEEYLVAGLGQNATVIAGNGTEMKNQTSTQAVNLTSNCLFSIAAPTDSLLRITFSSTSCTAKSWPADCKIVVSDIALSSDDVIDGAKNGSLLLNLRSSSNFPAIMSKITSDGRCSTEIFSTFNRIAVNVSSCSADLNAFDFSLAIDVAVTVDGAVSFCHPRSTFLTFFMALVAFFISSSTNR